MFSIEVFHKKVVVPWFIFTLTDRLQSEKSFENFFGDTFCENMLGVLIIQNSPMH